MQDWETDELDTDAPRKRSAGPARGGWFWPLTVLALILVGGLSMLMAFLTREIPNRPIWLMGLIFMIPAGAMFLSAMLLEFSTGVMTPRSSRGVQVRVAAIATALTFLVGCGMDAVYLYGGYFRDASVNYVFLLDRGDTISQDFGGTASGEISGKVLTELLSAMPEKTNVGLVSFDRHVLARVEMGYLTDGQRQQITSAASVQGTQGAAYPEAVLAAAEVAKTLNNGRETRIVILTTGREAAYVVNSDGDLVGEAAGSAYENELLSSRLEEVRQACVDAGCKVYVVTPDGQADPALARLTADFGSSVISAADASQTEDFKVMLTAYDGDMIRADTASSVVIAGIMLLLEGLVIGFGLYLLLSVKGQKRFQPVLSLLMAGVAAFLLKGVFLGNVPWWLEGACFSLFGVVFMCGNARPGNPSSRGGAVKDSEEEW